MRTQSICLKKMLRFTFLALFIPLFFGCSRELSRSEAEKQITQKFQLPKDELNDFSLKQEAGYAEYYYYPNGAKANDFGVPAYPPGGKRYQINAEQPKSSLYSALEADGFITVNKEQEKYREDNLNSSIGMTYIGEKFFYNASVTAKGKEFFVGAQVKVAKLVFGAITGIIERKEMNISEVNYTVIRNNITPFGKAFNISEQTINETATFTKYDDGWRINQ